ncbi:MAG: DNA integrity scanning protein DisA [Syntrophus sp. PtaB.Bin001]|jgi:uncharacterized protein (TIGR00159 family)|nr:MAG: DNA integrity scanning protein DisA [Syntrophus sp. PtaB.Bin001]
MLTRFWSMLKSFQIQDVFDIAIVAIMISAILIWFKDRASRFVLFGIGLLGLIYILARFFQLYLTTLVLQGFFAIFLFVIVVIFQEDFRRFFERLALLGSFKITLHEATPSNSSAEIIAHTADNLARRHIGALMVIAGNDPLDRHLTGGVKLDGLLSEQLLESIFDPHSKGHDGAVVIRENRIEQFGCHLPLTENIHPTRNFGLRHTAALGLSERCDAICVVVSEERGTVSLARSEKLITIKNAAELRNILEDFSARNAPAKPHRTFIYWLKEHPREKILALVFAFILWLSFGYQRDSVRRDFTVPIEYVNLAADSVLEGSKSTDAMVALTGPSQAFQLLNPEKLKISINLENIKQGRQEIKLTGEMITLPAGLSVSSIKPEHITISVSRFVVVEVPVEADVSPPPAGWTVHQITVNPSSARILVPEKMRSRRFHIKTETVSLLPTAESQIYKVNLIVPSDVRMEAGKTPEATVVVKLSKKTRISLQHPRKPFTEVSGNAAF